MASIIEQFRDLFVFAYGKKCDLGFAVPKNWGRENNTPETQSMTMNDINVITNGRNVLFARLRKQFDANWSITQIVDFSLPELSLLYSNDGKSRRCA